MRLLGGWVGYNLEPEAIWEKRMTDMEAMADKWVKRHPSYQGRVIAINYAILSKAQYMLFTNNPPKSIIGRIQKLVRRVMWAGKSKSVLKLEDVYRPVIEGGPGVPNIRAHQSAARLTWINKWRMTEDSRPTWAPILDEVVRRAAFGGPDKRHIRIFDQTWRETQGW